MKLYHHKTDGGAEYLTDTFISWEDIHNGKVMKKGREGTTTPKTKYIVRIDGDIKKDCELSVRDDKALTDEEKKIIKNALGKDFNFNEDYETIIKKLDLFN